jgi:photosystem II stability/assembly factor-like uncharacterized protein
VGVLVGLTFSDANHGYAVAGTPEPAGAAFLATSDGGRTWATRSLPAEVAALFDVTVTSSARVVAVGRRPGSYGPSVALASDDGGETWPTVADMPATGLWSVAGRGERVWALGGLTRGQVYRSDDGGGTWGPAVVLPAPALEDVAFADTEHGWAVGTQRQCLYVTSDGGATWAGLPLVPEARCTA